jgi:hypothetical protein
MKRTVIKYKEIGNNRVVITDIQNVATTDEIREELSKEGLTKYKDIEQVYYREWEGYNGILLNPSLSIPIVYVKVGDKMSLDKLTQVKKLMKEAGNRFTAIKKHREHTIII